MLKQYTCALAVFYLLNPVTPGDTRKNQPMKKFVPAGQDTQKLPVSNMILQLSPMTKF